MKIVELTSVDGYVAFDLDCPLSAGGTRLAPDVTRREAELLARAMTYKFAVLGERIGGAKAVLRATAEERAETVARYCREITPLVRSGVFLTSSDLGTRTQDFATLPDYRTDSVMHQEADGELVDTVVTGLGVVAAADAASMRVLVDEQISRLTAAALEHPGGPYAGSCAAADEFLAGWCDPAGLPEGPPLAPERAR